MPKMARIAKCGYQGVPYGGQKVLICYYIGSRPSEPKVADFHHHGAPNNVFRKKLGNLNPVTPNRKKL